MKLKTIAAEELKQILDKHLLWVAGKKEGVRADLSEADLRGANLRGVDLRGASLSGTDLRGANLRGTDLSGADLRGANLRGTDLSEADLRGANLRGADLRGNDLRGANLRGANLRGTDLSGASLSGTDLRGTDLSGADLRGTDLSGSNLEIPTVHNLHQKILEAIGDDARGLEMGLWHTCETTHCRAGWNVHLAGEAGRKLEEKIGTGAAGALIAIKSCPFLGRVPDFFASNKAALESIREAAEQERKASVTLGQ